MAMPRRYGRPGFKDPFAYTSSINHGLLTEKALRDVFDISSYINFGTAEEPLPYPVKFKDRDSFFGKQIMTMTPKWGFQTNDVFFQKEHPWVFDGDLFVDRNMYVNSQPNRYKGFGTSDFSKRDEYTNTMRTEQYREQLKDMGYHRTASQDYGRDAESANYEKPKYGNKPVIKQQMYRRTKIFFPDKTLLGFQA
ncbi:hypothetical protein R1sor_016329 [Riccia sorocarpa]|uniref:Uncharacterized protein n=1 Tax=Riccia sorocarpa TaxID=122646 RepID=A0ABD3HIT3_9MARC